jgi:capsular polysaccharide export protein
VALTLPLSLCLDRQRPHYDPSGSSDLEDLLARHSFSATDIGRAEKLIALCARLHLGKYGLCTPRPGTFAPGYALALGQVDDDASLRLGTRSVGNNLALLQAVREAVGPDVTILYRSHPDVRAGLRRGTVPSGALDHIGIVETELPTASLLAQASSVHVMTSLAGFEALMRQKEVHCYGWPFYSGWGLTTDHDPVSPLGARRSRRLTLAEAVSGAYDLYPLYIDPITRLPCDVFTAAHRIATGHVGPGVSMPLRLAWLLARRCGLFEGLVPSP